MVALTQKRYDMALTPLVPLALRSINSVRCLLSLVETEVGTKGWTIHPFVPLALRSIKQCSVLITNKKNLARQTGRNGSRGKGWTIHPLVPLSLRSIKQCSVLITNKKNLPDRWAETEVGARDGQCTPCTPVTALNKTVFCVCYQL